MVSTFEPWRQHLRETARRLVDYGADGIFLDSYGWQLNRPMRPASTAHFVTASEHARGVTELVDLVRSDIRRARPDGCVVLCESASGPMRRHADGGLTADFATFSAVFDEPAVNKRRLLGSPLRYADPHATIFTNGLNLGELHQVYAAGYGLALGCNWPGSFMHDSPDHIRKLIELRREFRDALIDGEQVEQPSTGSTEIIAYLYVGSLHIVLTVVNLSLSAVRQTIVPSGPDAGAATWTDPISGEVVTSNPDGSLTIDIGSRDLGTGLRILARKR